MTTGSISGAVRREALELKWLEAED